MPEEPTPEELEAIRDPENFDAPVKPAPTPKKPFEKYSKPETLQKKLTYLPDVHRLLPQSPDAEQGVLSSIALSPLESFSICQEKRITSRHFHIPAHGEIFNAMQEIINKGVALTFISLTQYLRDRNKLDEVGGAAMISSCWTFLGTATNIGYYLDILIEKFVLREIIRVCTEYAARSYDEQDEFAKLLDNCEKDTLAIRGELELKNDPPLKDVVMEVIGDIQLAYERRGGVTGVETGFQVFDQTINGLQPEMIVIAARPSQGKTAFALNIAEHIAINLRKSVAIFSLEMSKKQLVQRLILSRAFVNMQAIRNGFLAERDFPAITKAASDVAAAPFHIIHNSRLTIEEIQGKARRLKREHGIEAIFIDYLTLVRSMSKKSQNNREQEVAEVSAGCKAMTMELGIPVVVLAQIGRDFERRGPMTARPRLSDLRESGSIEQDADTVVFLVRPEAYAETDEEKKDLEGKAELIVAKQRNGPLGEVPLTFLKEFTRFQDRAVGDHETADEEAARQGKENPDLPL